MTRFERSVTTLVLAVAVPLASAGCSTWSNKAKGAVIGAGAGGAIGAAVGSRVGSTAKGAVIGAAVGGAAGAVIGHQMDQQAKELALEVEGARVERIGEGIVVTFEDGILYPYDSDVIMQNGRVNLQKLAASLEKYPKTDVLIVGHTDARGSDSYNEGLSQRRAASAANYLAAQGIARSRIRTEGRGEVEPIASNDTDEGRQLNRRVEIAIFASEALQEDAKRQSGSR